MRDVSEDYENKFARLLSVIPLFKTLNMKHSMALNNMKMQNPPAVKEFPELHKEIFDIKENDN